MCELTVIFKSYYSGYYVKLDCGVRVGGKGTVASETVVLNQAR